MQSKNWRPRSPRHGGCFDLDQVKAAADADEWETRQADFWKDQEHAQRVSRRLAERRDFYAQWSGLKSAIADLSDYAELADEEADAKAESDIKTKLAELQAAFVRLEFTTLMSDKYDDRDAIVAIHAGAGGTEAQDWAGMLLRMYLRYAERKGWKTKMLDDHAGAEAGIKSATFAVEGRYAYGYLKAEAGVHRLVRISPFDAEQLRHTSFALIEVLPDLGGVEETEIDPKDLRIDTFLSSGHGGQSVQTTYSAVRLTHIPTGIVVSCQNERSQLQNREVAMRILKAKLHAVAMKEREAEKKKLRGEFQSAEWGSQIRSYVLHPYKLVKDHRTKFEVQDTQAVLDGDLDPFIEQYLRLLKKEGT